MKGYILAIDDNAIDLRIVTNVIEQENFLSAAFTDYTQALKWLEVETPSLILLDLVMPNCSGFDLIPKIKKMAKLKSIPIMILSGVNGMADVKKALVLGASDYIVKPIDPMVLQEKIRKALVKTTFTSAEVLIPEERMAEAAISFSIKIKNISEFGITVLSSVAFERDQIITLNGLDVDVYGSRELCVRVYSCEKQGELHLLQLTYVGMSGSQRQHLRNTVRRFWIKSRQETI